MLVARKPSRSCHSMVVPSAESLVTELAAFPVGRVTLVRQGIVAQYIQGARTVRRHLNWVAVKPFAVMESQQAGGARRGGEGCRGQQQEAHEHSRRHGMSMEHAGDRENAS